MTPLRAHRRSAIAALTIALAALLSACGDDNGAASGGRLNVVASFYPMAEIATRVGGDRVKVTNLTPVGVEPHDVELSSRQVDKLEDASLVIYLGNDFQPAVAEIASRRKRDTLDVLDAVPLEKGASETIEADPHFWLDPTLMSKAADAITDALVQLSPPDAEMFRANAATYERTLSSLDADFAQGLAQCERKDLVTSHAAFFYLARRYGLTQLPIAGLSPEAEPNADRIAQLSDVIKAKGITTVFYEELVTHKVSETLAREAGVKTAVLSPIEGLTKDELDAKKDYVAVMRENLATLRQALNCR